MSDEQRKDEEVEGHRRIFPASDEATEETEETETEDESEVEGHVKKFGAHKLD